MEDFSTPVEVDPLKQRNPVTLTMLFYALTLAAILAACLRYVAIERSGTTSEFALSSMIGGVIGWIIGTFQVFSRNSHAWMSPVLGLSLGIVLGPLLRVKMTHFGTIIGLSFLGSWILVLIIALASKLNQR